MEKTYQMSDLEHNAFLRWCKSTETYKKVVLRTYSVEPNGDLFIPSGEMAREDFDNYYSGAENVEWDKFGGFETSYFKDGKYYSFKEAKEVKVKGYDKNAKFE